MTRPSPWVLVSVLAVMGIAAVFDIKTRKVPNQIPIFLGVIWIIEVCLSVATGTDGWKNRFIASLVSFTLTLIALLLTSKVFTYVTKQTGIGGGDIKLLSFLSLILDLEYLFVILFSACVSSVMFFFVRSCVKDMRKRKNGNDQYNSSSQSIKKITFPFVPFIALGVAVCFGISYYLQALYYF